jgi:thiol-disulfide isomerase/thioredoxin
MMKANLVLLLAAPAIWAASGPPAGLWDATVTVNKIQIPFRMEIAARGSKATGAFFNGAERVTSTAGQFSNSTLTLQFAHYASRLEATWDGAAWTGVYYRPNKVQYPFEARRFVPASAPDASIPNIAGLWDIAVKSSKGENAWRLVVRQSGAAVTGAILRVDGDTGELSGSFRDGKFVMSHFSGARPALVELTPHADGSLEVIQNKQNAYKALRSSDARVKGLPEPTDPSRHTSVKDPTERFRFEGIDLAGKTVTQDDARFAGKVVLLSIGGSWCPNCHDEAPFLVELDREYRGKGLRIVLLSFEEADQLKDPTRLRAFIQQYGIKYTALLGGEQEQVRDRLPQAVNLNTWPATFFIGRDGLVRGVHAGFAGPATGEEHTRLKAEVRATVEKLLAETNSTTRASIE